MKIKFVSMLYKSTTTDEEVQMKLSGICDSLKKNGYSVINTQMAFDSKHSKILFNVNYK